VRTNAIMGTSLQATNVCVSAAPGHDRISARAPANRLKADTTSTT
jgi:hypothetical protein